MNDDGGTDKAPLWTTCKHDGGWQYLAMNQLRCRKCNVVRFSPMEAADMTMISKADLAWMRARTAQLEKALEPFGFAVFEAMQTWDLRDGEVNHVAIEFGTAEIGDDGENFPSNVQVLTLKMEDALTAVQVLGYMDPETEPKSQ